MPAAVCPSVSDTWSDVCSGPGICELPAGQLQLTSCRRCRRPSPSHPVAIQNATASLVSGAGRHWPHHANSRDTSLATSSSATERLIFKTSVPVWKCLHDAAPVVEVDRRIRWHYTTTILRFRIGARLTRYRNCKFHNGCRTISRRADGISRYLSLIHIWRCRRRG